MADIKPPFTLETAQAKVKFAQDMWNTQDPHRIAKGYTSNSIWRNRTTFLCGTDQITTFLTQKWDKEKNYRLRKELFCFSENKIAVQFFYEYQDATDEMRWKRCYGLEDWTFETEGPERGKMRKRMMSGNDLVLGVDGDGVGRGEVGEEGWVDGRWFTGTEEGGVCGVKGMEGVDSERVTGLLSERHL